MSKSKITEVTIELLVVEPLEELVYSCLLPTEWEYLIISETTFKSHQGLGFEAFAPFCRATREKIIAESESRLAL